MRETVAYAVRRTSEWLRGESEDNDTDTRPRLDFVYPVSWENRGSSPYLGRDETDEAEEFLERVRTWVEDDTEEYGLDDSEVEIRTEVLESDEYLFSLGDYAETVIEYARANSLDHVILDPEYHPGGKGMLLTPLRTELSLAEGITYEEAPVDREVRGRRLLRKVAEPSAFGATFLVSFLFYQLLGGFSGSFDYITGGVTGLVVASVVSGVTFESGVKPVSGAATWLRWLAYVPYLLWKTAVANIEVAYVVLHPDLPIDPSMEKYRPIVSAGLPATTLANSITLTPGTVTVDVRGNEFKVHALTRSAREGLYGGKIERGVRFVFLGRRGLRLPSPEERGDVLTGDEESQREEKSEMETEVEDGS